MASNNLANGFGLPYYQSPREQSAEMHDSGMQPPRYQGFAPPGGSQQTSQQYPSSNGLPPFYSTSSESFGGNAGLGPSPLRFDPRASYQDVIVRPDSSVSNASFATQLPHPPFTPFQQTQQSRLSGRPPYLGQSQANWMQQYSRSSDDAMRGLGAGMSKMTLSGSMSSPQLATVSEGSGSIQSSRHGSIVASVNGGSLASRTLAQSIKNGETEDPWDKSLKRFDTPQKNSAPSLGPARFKDSKMFSTTGQDQPDIDFAGASTPHPRQGPAAAPAWLDFAVQDQHKPSFSEACDALPFTELCRNAFPSVGGVIRVKDIPYGTSRQEMVAFLGRNAQILRQPEGSPYHAVHVMMERETGKTMDCFIELATPNEAAWVVRQFAARVNSKRPAKVQDRPVEVTYSSQDELLQELFPRAKHVRWSGGQPIVDTAPRRYYADQSAAGFQGFIHSEELVMLQKHASLSDRSPFASKSPCRVYESMITTLNKFPWYAVDFVAIRERRAIFDCCTSLIRTLVEQLRRGDHRRETLDPTPTLLQELVVATLSCPGFTEKQKASIVAGLRQSGYATMYEGRSVNVALGGCHEYSNVWPFAALSYIPGTDDHLIKYFAKLFREATAAPQTLSLAARKAAEASGADAEPMGHIKIDYGPDPGSLSLAEVAKIEYNKIEELLKLVCRTSSVSSSTSAPFSSTHGSGSSTSLVYTSAPASIRGPGNNSQGSYSSDGTRST